MTDLVKRSLQIVSNSAKEISKDYTHNFSSLINDANTIRVNITKAGKNATEVYARIKSGSVTKKISDWFYQKDAEYDQYDSGVTEEFDPGFKIDSSSDEETKGSSSKSIDIEAMTDISKTQLSAMYKIGHKQTEQEIANTAEIVSSVNNRSTEMLAAINNVNSTLINVSSKMDKLIELNAMVVRKDDTNVGDKTQLFNDGRLTLSSVYQNAASSINNNPIVSIGGNIIKSLMSNTMRPEDLLALGLQEFVLNKPINALGGKSIDSIGKTINETVGAITHNVLSEIIETGPFKKFFGGMTNMEANKDYSTLTPNKYNTNRAVFDGMTRHSIISIIPEYLKKINESLSGKSYNINEHGRLTTNAIENRFNKITDVTFSSSGISSSFQQHIANSSNNAYDSNDVDTAARALSAVYVMHLHKSGIRQIRFSQLSDCDVFVSRASKMLSEATGKTAEYWSNICMTVMLSLSNDMLAGTKFVQSVNSKLNTMINEATEFAVSSNGIAGNRAGKLEFDTMKDRFVENFKKNNNSNNRTNTSENTVTPSSNITSNTTKYSLIDYTRGIFGILNRGINIRNVDTSNGYGRYNLFSTTSDQTDYSSKRITPVKVNNNNDTAKVDVSDMHSSTGNNSSKADANNQQQPTSAENSTVGLANKTINSANYTTHDYVRGIYSILNRGINVRSHDVSTEYPEFKPMKLSHTSDDTGPQDIFTAKAAVTKLVRKGLGKSLAPTKTTTTSDANDTTETSSDDTSTKQTESKTTNNIIDNIIPKPIRDIFNKMTNHFRHNSNTTTSSNSNSTEPPTLDDILDNKKKDVRRIQDAIVGTANVDNSGKITYGNDGILQNVRDKFNGTIDKATSKIRDIGTATKDKAANSINNIEIARENKILAKDINNMDHSTPEDRDDQETSKRVLAMMQTAMADGNASDIDISNIMSDINQIHNPTLRSRLERSVNGMLNNGSKKSSGIFGKLKLVAGTMIKAAKKLLSPMFTILKVALTKIGSVIGKIYKGLGKLFFRGATNIAAGAKSMAQGLFGTREIKNDKGEVTQQKMIGLTQWTLKLIPSIISHTAGSEGFKKLSKVISSAAGTIKNLAKSAISSIGNVISHVSEALPKMFSGVKNVLSSTIGKLGNTGVLSKAKNAIGNVKNKIANTEFAKGFMSSFKEAKGMRDKAREASLEVQTVADRETKEIKDILTNSSGTSILNTIANFLEGIRDNLSEKAKDAVSPEENLEENTADNNAGNNNGSNDNNASNTNTTNNTGTNNGSADRSTGRSSSHSTTTSNANTTHTATSVGDASASSDVGAGHSGSTGHNSGGGIRGIASKAGESVKGVFSGGNILGSLGKIFGGFTSMLGGILEAVIAAVAGLEGLQTLTDLVNNILVDGVKPLNDVFNKLVKMLKPVAEILTKIVSSIAEAVTNIVGSLIDTIQPIIESLMPILDVVLDILKPILGIVTSLVKILLVPFMAVFNKIVVPAIKLTAGVLEIISGVVQIGFGNTQLVLGGILTVLGKILEFIGIKGVTAEGKKLMQDGLNMQKNGLKSIVQGGKDTAAALVSVVSPKTADKISGKTEEDTDKSTEQNKNVIPETIKTGGSVMDGLVASGDITTISNIYNNTYGSGNITTNQHSYGNYMNMSERGCGPVALADAFSRRTGQMVNPMQLASSMATTGAYNPKRGTSVGGFMSTGSSLGMNIRTGGVTTGSLRRATPNNPITLIGSGPAYGTHVGNNHYVNVIGADKYGSAYVSNPLTGRIEKHPTASLVRSSKMGIYGSGDSDSDSLYEFDEGTKSALDELKKLTGNILSMFTGEKSADEETQELLDEESDKSAANNVLENSDDKKSIIAAALSLFKKDTPKLDGESDKDYDSRVNKLFNSSKQNEYVLKWANDPNNAYQSKSKTLSDMSSAVKVDKDGNIISDIMTNLSSIADAPIKTLEEMINPSSSANGSSGIGIDTTGYTPKYTDVDMTDEISGYGSHASKHSPLHDFFAQKSGSEFTYSTDGNWFKQETMTSPNKEGVGDTGRNHGGIDFLWPNGSEGQLVYAPVGGKKSSAVYNITREGNPDDAGGCGNNVAWQDTNGKYHWMMHLKTVSDDVINHDEITPGMLIGTVGNTGDSQGAHLHYTVTDSMSNRTTYLADKTNPLTYIGVDKLKTGDTVSLGLVGDDNQEKTWNYLRYTLKYGPKATAGIMGNFMKESTLNPANVEDRQEDWIAANLGPKTEEEYTKALYQNFVAKEPDEPSLTKWLRTGLTYNNSNNLSAGYGIVQWTDYNRKKGLLDYARKYNLMPDNLGLQLGYFDKEMKYENYKPLRDYLKDENNHTVDEFAREVNSKYEIGSEGNLIQDANDAYAKFKDRARPDYKYGNMNYGLVNNAVDANRMNALNGSGDISSDDDYLHRSIYGNGDESIFTIPEIDDQSNTYYDSSLIPNQYIINKYQIKPDSSTDNRLNKIISNTFNVRSERIEALLEKIIDKMGDDITTTTSDDYNTPNKQVQDLFKGNAIPEQVTRLSQ